MRVRPDREKVFRGTDPLPGVLKMSERFDHFMEEVRRNGYDLFAAEMRQGGKTAGAWYRFASKPRFESFSLAKTFMAAGTGIAAEEGLITLDEKVWDTLGDPSYVLRNDYPKDLTVRDVLTMTSGMEKAVLFRDSYERAHERDWLRYIFEQPFSSAPGSTFLYTNVCAYLLGALVGKKAGVNMLEYMRDRLFEPLQIHNPDMTVCPKGHTVGANGLAVNVTELANFAEMLLNGGVFGGKRILPEAFVHDMTAPHVVTNEAVPTRPGTPLSYGYQLWVDTAHEAFFLWGIFGQYAVVVPRKELVIVTQGLVDTDGGSNGDYHFSPFRKLIWETFLEE